MDQGQKGIVLFVWCNNLIFHYHDWAGPERENNPYPPIRFGCRMLSKTELLFIQSASVLLFACHLFYTEMKKKSFPQRLLLLGSFSSIWGEYLMNSENNAFCVTKIHAIERSENKIKTHFTNWNYNEMLCKYFTFWGVLFQSHFDGIHSLVKINMSNVFTYLPGHPVWKHNHWHFDVLDSNLADIFTQKVKTR